MEPNDSQLSSFYRHLQQQQQQQQSNTTTATTTTVTPTTTGSPTNGLLANTDGSHSHSHSQILYPHSVPSVLEPAKKKRGRPRKYGSPAQALAAKKASTSSSHSSPPPGVKKNHAFPASSTYTPSSSKKSHSFFLGNAGQGFIPHVITVAAGEPATTGGNITYEGRFEIISLTGSYVRNELGGRTGGLSVCLSNTDGQIVGGGVGGPLKAAGPVQVIVGTFFIDAKKDAGNGIKGDASGSKLLSPVGESVSSLGFHPAVDSSSGNPILGNDEHQAIGESHFMIQQHGVHMTPSRPLDWGGRPDSINAGFELIGRTGHVARLSPQNGDYDQIPD